MRKQIIVSIFIALFVAGCGKSPDKLIQILKNDVDPANRYDAAIKLGKLKAVKAVKPLLESYKIEDNYVRTGILRAIAEIGAPQTLDFLIKEYKNVEYNNLDMRIIALSGLGNYKNNPKAIAIIKEAIDDNNFKIREQAIRSYGKAKGASAVKELVDLLDIRSEHEKVIVETLGEIRSKLAVIPLIKQFNRKLLTLPQSSEFIKYYVETFAKINDKRFIPPLVKAYFLTNPYTHPELQKTILNALDKLKINHQYGKVLANVLNLRTQPTIRAKVVGKATKGEILKILKRSKLQFILDNQKDYWYYCVNENGEKGWVFGNNLWVFDFSKEKEKL